jgi:hypothetical protein
MSTALLKASVVTSYECPPIPTRAYDWMATRDGYDPGDPIGHGATEDQAIADLVEQEEARFESCGACDGTGRVAGESYYKPGWERCVYCEGEGRVS